MTEASKAYHDMWKRARRKFLKLQSDTHKNIENTFKDFSEELKSKKVDSKNIRQTDSYKKYVRKKSRELQKPLVAIQTMAIIEATKIPNDVQLNFWDYVRKNQGTDISKLSATIGVNLSRINKEVIDTISQGSLYVNGRGLSEAVWRHASFANNDMQNFIINTIKNKDYVGNLADDLAKYVNPLERKMQSNIIGRQVDFNSLRFARTAIKDAYRLDMYRSAQLNPYAKILVYELSANHESRMHGRRDMCDDYAEGSSDGLAAGHYYLDKIGDGILITHPQCICNQWVDLEKDLDEITDDICNWIKGEGSYPELDDWLKGMNDRASNIDKIIVGNGIANKGESGIIKGKTDKNNNEDKKMISQIRQDIKNGKYPLKINTEKQNRHIKDTEEYNQYVKNLRAKKDMSNPSILTLDAQEFVNSYSGSGKIRLDRNGNWNKRETIILKSTVGYLENEDSTKQFTNTASIRYSNTGTHVVPIEGQAGDKE